MSGGAFDYKQYYIEEIADTIEQELLNATCERPEPIKEDYWTFHTDYKSQIDGSIHVECSMLKMDTYDIVCKYIENVKHIKPGEILSTGFGKDKTPYYLKNHNGDIIEYYVIYHYINDK